MKEFIVFLKLLFGCELSKEEQLIAIEMASRFHFAFERLKAYAEKGQLSDEAQVELVELAEMEKELFVLLKTRSINVELHHMDLFDFVTLVKKGNKKAVKMLEIYAEDFETIYRDQPNLKLLAGTPKADELINICEKDLRIIQYAEPYLKTLAENGEKKAFKIYTILAYNKKLSYETQHFLTDLVNYGNKQAFKILKICAENRSLYEHIQIELAGLVNEGNKQAFKILKICAENRSLYKNIQIELAGLVNEGNKQALKILGIYAKETMRNIDDLATKDILWHKIAL